MDQKQQGIRLVGDVELSSVPSNYIMNYITTVAKAICMCPRIQTIFAPSDITFGAPWYFFQRSETKPLPGINRLGFVLQEKCFIQKRPTSLSLDRRKRSPHRIIAGIMLPPALFNIIRRLCSTLRAAVVNRAPLKRTRGGKLRLGYQI